MNQHAADWIQVDDSVYNEVLGEVGPRARGLVIEMTLSPYDVPDQVRGEYVESSKKFIIDFKYIDSEATRELRLDDHVTAEVGARSGRVYALAIDVDSMSVDSISLKFAEEAVRSSASRAFDKLSSFLLGQRDVKKNEGNYSVANRIVSDHWPTLKRELIHSP